MDLVLKDSGEAAHEANAGALTITTTRVKSRNAIAARCCALERAALLLCCAGGRGAEAIFARRRVERFSNGKIWGSKPQAALQSWRGRQRLTRVAKGRCE